MNLVIAAYAARRARLGARAACLARRHPLEQARAAGALLGTKTVINELVAYLDLSKWHEASREVGCS